jgi:hypothetical protein
MANHKRGRSKNQRAGCLLCKPHKANGAKQKDPPNEARKLQEPVAAAVLARIDGAELDEIDKIYALEGGLDDDAWWPLEPQEAFEVGQQHPRMGATIGDASRK